MASDQSRSRVGAFEVPEELDPFLASTSKTRATTSQKRRPLISLRSLLLTPPSNYPDHRPLVYNPHFLAGGDGLSSLLFGALLWTARHQSFPAAYLPVSTPGRVDEECDEHPSPGMQGRCSWIGRTLGLDPFTLELHESLGVAFRRNACCRFAVPLRRGGVSTNLGCQHVDHEGREVLLKSSDKALLEEHNSERSRLGPRPRP